MKILVTGIVTLLVFSIIGIGYDSAFGQLSPKVSSVSMTKTPNPAGPVLPNTLVTYSYTVTNTGTNSLLCKTINDNKLGNVFTGNQLLTSGSSFTRTASTTLTTLGPNTNTATVSCVNDANQSVTFTTSATVTVLNPSVDIEKSANPAGPVTPGTTVTYTYDVTNIGNEPITCGPVSDDQLGAVSGGFSLGVGATTQFTDSDTLGSTTTNTASVTCTGDQTGATASDSDTVTVQVNDPMVDLEKSANPTTIMPGESTTYTYDVTNTGDEPITCGPVSDSELGDVSGGGFSLGVGATTQFTQSATLQVTTTNTASVTCTGDLTGATAIDAASTTVTVARTSVDLIKQASDTSVDAGDTVTYTYDVTNNGDSIINCGPVFDDKLAPGPVGLGVSNGDVGQLSPGNSKSYTATTDIFVTTKNIATVSCVDDSGNIAADMDMKTVTVIIVGGDFLPIDSTALFIGGIQLSLIWILPTIAGIAGTAGMYYIKTRNNEE